MGYDLRAVCRELSRVVRDLLVLSVDRGEPIPTRRDGSTGCVWPVGAIDPCRILRRFPASAFAKSCTPLKPPSQARASHDGTPFSADDVVFSFNLIKQHRLTENVNARVVVEKPFGRDLAPGMLHRHTAHGEAVARIGWCVTERALGVITGEVGAGKTVAVRAALAGLDPSRHTIIYLGNPAVGARGLYHGIVTALYDVSIGDVWPTSKLTRIHCSARCR